MITINDNTDDAKSILEAVKGDYGFYSMQNGISVQKQGNLCTFYGFFNGTQSTIEIPKIQTRVPVLFFGDSFACMAVAEPNAGFVSVPTSAKNKRFAVLANCILNYK